MTKPSNLYEWATELGQTLEPKPDEKQLGFNEYDMPPARWINWLWNGSHLWHKYTDNLHNELEFLNKVYAWIGNHVFDAEEGNVLQVGGMHNASRLRTYTGVELVNGLASCEIKYTNAAGLAVGRQTSKLVPIDFGRLPTGNEVRRKYLALPHEALLTRARAVMYQKLAPISRNALVSFKREVVDAAEPYGPSSITDLAATWAHSATPGYELADSGPIAELINNATTYYFIEFRASDTADYDEDYVPWLELQFLDPGPRNR